MEQAIQTWICIHDNIHPYTEGEEDKLEPSENKDTFVGYRVLHMEIDEEEQVTPPMVRQTVAPSTSSEEARV
jgi:hypothetical protein